MLQPTQKVKCYRCEFAQKIQHWSFRQNIVFARYKERCLKNAKYTLLMSTNQPLNINIVNNHTIPNAAQNQQKTLLWDVVDKFSAIFQPVWFGPFANRQLVLDFSDY